MRAIVDSFGYRHAYNDCDMICRDPHWGDDQPLPAGAVA